MTLNYYNEQTKLINHWMYIIYEQGFVYITLLFFHGRHHHILLVYFPLPLPDHQDTFTYLNQGDSATITGVDDAADFQETCKALSLLGISDSSLRSVFTILAAILHLGNVEIVDTSADSCEIPVSKWICVIGK